MARALVKLRMLTNLQFILNKIISNSAEASKAH